MKKITIIGSGKTATALSLALKTARHTIVQVYSRDISNAIILASKLEAEAVSNLSEINTVADIYLVAVKDDAIAEVSAALSLQGKIIAHTSGIKEKELLNTVSENYGVFYPFVSMAKDAIIDFSQVLLMIEGSNENTLSGLRELAKTISNNVLQVDAKQRQSLHLSAVFAHNFTNHLYAIAENILLENGLSFDYLRPLLETYSSNLQSTSPSKLQTGPAIRGDVSTIEKHLQLLEGKEDLKEIYNLLSAHIQAI